MWYYLSNDGKLEPAIINVRAPKMAFQESETPRLCIAPTVSQCILGLSKLEGDFFIYEVGVSDPMPADSSVGDRKYTKECWITQKELDFHQGSIPLRNVGIVNINKDLRLNLKIAITRKELPTGWETREERLWEVKDGRWVPKFDDPNQIPSLLL